MPRHGFRTFVLSKNACNTPEIIVILFVHQRRRYDHTLTPCHGYHSAFQHVNPFYTATKVEQQRSTILARRNEPSVVTLGAQDPARCPF